MTQPAAKAFSSQLSTRYYVHTNPNGAEKNWPANPSEVMLQSKAVIWARKGGSAGLAVIALVETAVAGAFTVLSFVVYPVSKRPYRFCAEWLQESALTILWNVRCGLRLGRTSAYPPHGIFTEWNQPTNLSVMHGILPEGWATEEDLKFLRGLPQYARGGCRNEIFFEPFSDEWVRFYQTKGSEELSTRCKAFSAEGKKYVIHTIEVPNELYMMEQLSNLKRGPNVLRVSSDRKQVVMEYITTPTITPAIAAPHCKEIGNALKQVHGIPLSKDSGEGFEAANRTRWKYIQAQAAVHQTALSKSLLEGSREAMDFFESGMKLLAERKSPLIATIHTDPHPRNLFWTEDRGFLMGDWESASHGHPYFDVASLAIFLGMDAPQEAKLLHGYFGRAPTAQELDEYALLKKIRWAYTCIVNAMWAYRVLAKNPTSNDVPPPNKDFRGYMQFWGERSGAPLEFFVNVSRLAWLCCVIPSDDSNPPFPHFLLAG